jgi:hypothetical protein
MSAINRRVERRRQPDDFRKVFAVATETALTLVTVVVVSRRMSGAFHGPVSPAVPCLVATLAVLFSLAALAVGMTAAAPTVSPRKRILATALAVLPPVALGAALWLSPSAFVVGYLVALATACLLGAVAIQDRAAGSPIANSLHSTLFQHPATVGGTGDLSASVHSSGVQEQHWPTSRDSTALAEVQCHPKDAPPADPSAEEESLEMPDEEREPDDSIVQWMTRRRLPDGGELIEGAVKIDLDPAEKVGVAHLAFVPPLGCDPRAECHLLCDFDGRVRITVAKSYGLRIEARHSGEPSLSSTVNVAFSAQVPPAASRAAA